MRIAILSLVGLLLAGTSVLGQANEIKGHEALVYGVALSPDGKTLATAGFDKVVKLWSFPEGKETKTLTGHTAPVYCVAWSPDGQTLASGSLDKTIRLWKVADGSLLRELKGHTLIVDSVAFSPDGKTLASASEDKNIKLWNVADGKELKTLTGHQKTVYSVAFDKDGKQLVSAGGDNLVKVWDVAGGKETKTLKGLDKDGKALATSHEDAVMAALFTPDNTGIVSIGASLDRTLRLWDAASGAEKKKLGPTPDDPFGLAFSRDGKTLAISGYGGHLHLWDLKADKFTATKKIAPCAYCVTFTPDGKALITGHDNKSCYVTPMP